LIWLLGQIIANDHDHQTGKPANCQLSFAANWVKSPGLTLKVGAKVMSASLNLWKARLALISRRSCPRKSERKKWKKSVTFQYLRMPGRHVQVLC
jgi:hypothetical protein